MVLVLGKDLDKFNDSLATREPYMLKDDSPIGARYMTGTDLMRSAKISDEWKIPDAFYAQAYSPKGIGGQTIRSFLGSIGDVITNTPDELRNLAAQRALEKAGEETPSDSEFYRSVRKFGDITGITKPFTTVADIAALGIMATGSIEDIKERAKTFDEAVTLLKNRDYSSEKYARRVIAETTDTIETRKLVREMYNQSQGIDSTKWYNQTANILGAMLPTMALARFGGGIGLRAGLSRAGATRLATGIIAGTSGLESAGQYAEETAAEYLARTGDRTFSDFTASDATGLSAMAYGAMAGMTETIGGAEMLVTGALKRAGVKSLGRALLTTGTGEALEETLQTLEEGLTRVVDRTNNKTLGQWLEEAAVGAAYGFFIGGASGSVAHLSNRGNLIKGIKKLFPNLEEKDVNKVVDNMIDSVGEISSREPGLWGKLRQKVAYMYENADIENKEDRIDAITDLEYSLIVTDSVINGTEVADNPLFKGEINAIGWFREGVSESARPVVNNLLVELENLQSELKKLNESEQKDYEKIDKIEEKLEKFDKYVESKLKEFKPVTRATLDSMLKNVGNEYVKATKKKYKIITPTDLNITDEQKSISAKVAENIREILKSEGFDVVESKKKGASLDGASYIKITRRGQQSPITFRIGYTEVGEAHNGGSVNANYNLDTMSQESILSNIRRLLKQKSIPTSNTTNVNMGFIPRASGVMRQSKVKGVSRYGAYIPQLRFILRTNKMDATSLSNALAHDWFSRNFDRYRSGKASKEFMRSWGALEKALGISENAAVPPKKASEAFARAYEGWIMDKADWSQIINVEDKDKDSVIKLMQDYQAELRDIYEDLTSDYFKDTWGKLGELKPELKEWFDFATNIKDLDILVSRGEMTADQAQQEKINQALDTVIENTENPESKKQLKIARTLNDTKRYEAEGGNKNSLQKRLASLAQAIDENNLLIKENYDTHRDMLEVAKQADNFVRTRLDDALKIINGEMAEQEGLFKEDIYTALERLALENGDLNLLDELKNSEIANRLAKELGQRVAGFRNWSAGQVDVVSAVKSLDGKFSSALKNKKAQVQLNETTKLFEKTQEEQDKIADKQLDETLKELECK